MYKLYLLRNSTFECYQDHQVVLLTGPFAFATFFESYKIIKGGPGESKRLVAVAGRILYSHTSENSF